MKTDIDWKVGGTVYVVPDDRRWRSPNTAVISKVGRKYATLGEGYGALRADLETGRINSGDCSYGKAWSSKEVYESHKRLYQTWNTLRRGIDQKRFVPDGCTEEDIKAAMAMLKLTEQ